jgi:hypothetical protein
VEDRPLAHQVEDEGDARGARRRDERPHVLRERWYGFGRRSLRGRALLEILSRHANPSAVLDALPDALSTPELHVAVAEGEQHALVRELGESATFPARAT